MTYAREAPPRWGDAAGLVGSISLAADPSKIAPNPQKDQAQISRNPRAVREARLWLIREDLYASIDEIRIFAERGLAAIDIENDLDLGRAFDQSVKHFLAVAENLKELIAVKTGERNE
jgi:hypothetical protein